MRFNITIIVYILILCILCMQMQAKECDPPCRNGGRCDTDSGYCICTKDWVNTNKDPDCKTLSCNMGEGPSADKNECDCTGTGFDQINCLGCESDHACNVAHNFTSDDGTSWHCSKDLVPIDSKRFFCGVSEEMQELLGEKGTFECDKIYPKQNISDDARNRCWFQTWGYNYVNAPGVQTQLLDCTFEKCAFNLYHAEDTNEVMGHYECAKTIKCRCSLDGEVEDDAPYCLHSAIANFLPGMKGKAWVDCHMEGENKNQCTLNQEELLGIMISMEHCQGRECYFNSTIPPIPEPRTEPLWWIGLIVGGIVVAIVMTLLTTATCWSIVHYYVIKREYKAIGGEFYGAKLEFTNISYFLKTSLFKPKQQLLHDVTHVVNPGEVLAIMGPSGAGKTTLLDILANRNKAGTIKGTRKLNGRKYGRDFNRLAAYVSQDDCLMGTLTVYESLLFAARVKLPACIPMKEKKKRIKQVMFDLKISKISNRRIGDKLHRGISGGERRRVAIAMELIGDPHIIFLDEPTSGLDAASAFTVIHSLVKLAKKYNKTIIFSIHQPRTNIFAEFDSLLLLSQGRIKYVGAADKAAAYFRSQNLEVPQTGNVADHLIDIIVDAEHSGRDLPFIYPKKEYDTVLDSDVPIYGSKKKYHDSPSLLTESRFYTGRLTQYATSFMTQLWALSLRALTNIRRDFFLFPAHFISSIIIGLTLGVVYWQQGNDFNSVQNRLGALFFILTVLSFTSMSALELFTSERVIYVGERANGYYNALSYFVTKVLFDILPLRILPAVIMGSICYYMINFRNQVAHFGYFILVLVLFNVASTCVCIAVAAISPTVAAANIITIVIVLSSAVFGGFLLNRTAMPPWLSWVRYLSLYNYSFEVLAVNDLWDFQVKLDPLGFKELHIPPLRVNGQFVLGSLGLSNKWFFFDIAMLALYALVLLGLSAVLLIFFVREKR